MRGRLASIQYYNITRKRHTGGECIVSERRRDLQVVNKHVPGDVPLRFEQFKGSNVLFKEVSQTPAGCTLFRCVCVRKFHPFRRHLQCSLSSQAAIATLTLYLTNRKLLCLLRVSRRCNKMCPFFTVSYRLAVKAVFLQLNP